MKYLISVMTLAAMCGLAFAQATKPAKAPATAKSPATATASKPAPSAAAPAKPPAPPRRGENEPPPPTKAPTDADPELTYPAFVPTPASAPAAGPTCRAIIIAGQCVLPDGIAADKAYARNVLDWTYRFYNVLTKQCGFQPSNVILLADTDKPRADIPTRKSTLENVWAAFDQFNKVMGPQDQFVLFLAGVGQVNEPVGKLCLPGPDLRSDDLGERLDKLMTKKIILVNTASGGADFLKQCLVDGRVILTAGGTETDGLNTYFGEFFVRGFETGRADANHDKLIDCLEAYVYAAKETCNFYHRQYLLMAKLQKLKAGEPIPWLVRGKETRRIWRRLYEGTDNIMDVPKKLEKDQEALPADLENEPDPECKFGRFGPNWYNRRVLTENSRLDDQPDTKKAIFMWKPYEFETIPEAPKPGEPTWLARQWAFGKPEPLKVDAKPPAAPAK